MADDNKLWFEMGVRDNVTNSLGKILQLTKVLGGEMDKVVASASLLGKIDKVKFENGQAVRNALNFQNMLTTIDNLMNRINGRKITATVGVEKLDQAYANLEKFRDQLLRLQEISGDNWNGDMLRTQQTAMRNMLNVVNGLLREQSEEERNATKASRDLSDANNKLASTYYKVQEAGRGTNRVLEQLGNQVAGYLSLYGAERMLKSIVTIGGEFEMQHVALQNILGDVQEANTLFTQLQGLAVESPKTFMELTTFAKQLSAYQIPANELFDTTKRLADLSAGLGVDMNRLILAYGQVRSAAVLRGQELRQFTEAGIPMVQALADRFTEMNGKLTTTADVFALISKRAVPFEMVKDVLWDLTDQGGQFYNMQGELADTLLGKYQKLQDSWQIMLGRIADGKNLTGAFLKETIELMVGLINSFDKLMPMLGMFAMARIGRGIFSGLENRRSNLTGESAIRDMEIAKLKQANALERQRIINGRQLNAIEMERVRTKQMLTANEYSILLAEGQISEKQLVMLARAGKINSRVAMRLALMQGYTKEQIRQIANQSRMSLMMQNFGGFAGMAKGAFGAIKSFLGGWPGLIMTAVGAAYSVYEMFNAKNEELSQKGDAMMSHAQQSSNQLSTVLATIGQSGDDTSKKIEVLERTLLDIGQEGKRIVAESRSIDDIGNRIDSLTEKAKAYQEVLDTMGGNKGKSLYEEAIDNSDIEERIDEYENLRNAENKQAATLERFSAKYQQMIDALKSKHKELNDELTSNNLYENLRKLMTGNYASEAVGYFALNTPYRDALNSFYSSVRDSDKALEKIEKESIPKAMNALKAMAREAGVDVSKNFEDLSDAEKTKLISIASEFAKGLERASNDTKDDIANWVTQGFYSKLYLTPILNVSEETGFALSLAKWQEANGYGTLWDKTTRENAMTDPLGFSKKNSQRKVDLEKKISQLNTQLKSSVLDPEYRSTLQGQLDDMSTELDGLNKSLEDGKWVFDKSLTKGGSKEGSKKDTQLEALRNRIDLYKRFYQELQGYKNIYTEIEALDILKKNSEFGKVFDMKDAYGIKNLADYKGSIDALTAGFEANTEARQKLINTTKADIENKQRKEAIEGIKTYVSELQKMMSVMSDNYKTYRKWLDLTGDESLAARAAGVTQNTSYESYLRDLMRIELSKNKKFSALTPDDVFGLSEKDVLKFGKESGIVAVWEDWRKHQQLLKKEQWDLYEEAIKNAKDYDDKIEDVNRHLEKQVEALEAIGANNELIQKVRMNAADQISELQWEKFKKDNDWGRVFGDLDNMSLTTIRNMVDAMKKFQKETRLSEKETRAWQKAMKDLTNKEITIDPVNSLTKAIERYNNAVKAQAKAKEAKENADKVVAAIQGEIVTNPQAAEKKQKKLEAAIKKQTEANKELTRIENEASESFNDLKKSVSAIANSFSSLGSNLSSLGSSVGGDFGNILGGFGSMMSSLGKGMSSINNLDLNAKGFTGIFNKVSAVLSVVSAMVDMNKALASILPSTESIYERRAAEQREINLLREAVDSYRVALAKARAEEKGWIGDNPLRKLQDAYQIHGEVVTEYYNKLYEAQEAYVESAAGIKSALIPIIAAITTIVAVAAGIFTAGTGTVALGALGAAAIGALSAGTVAVTGITAAAIGTAIAAGVGYAVGQAVQAGIDAITYDNGQVDARSNMKVQTQHRTFFRGEKTQNLEEWTKENLGLDLFDKSGLIDLKVAQAVLDSGITLVGETKETLEKLMELREEYDEWEKSIKDYISSTFGGLADDLTNAVWDWLAGGKNALDSFRNYASDTFKNIAQDAVKSFLKMAVLDKFEEQLESLYKAYSMQDNNGNRVIDEQQLMLGVASLAGDMAIAFEQILPVAESLGQTIANAFQYQGYDVVNGSSSSSSSSSTIRSSIAEGGTDVIVGYINSIRADVSVNRITLSQILIEVQAQRELPAIAKRQLEELSKISSNTSVIASNTEKIAEIHNLISSNILGSNHFHVK